MTPDVFPQDVSPEVCKTVQLLYLRTRLVFQAAELLDEKNDMRGNRFAIEALSGSVRGALEEVFDGVNQGLEEDLQYLLRRLSQFPDAYQALTDSLLFRAYATLRRE